MTSRLLLLLPLSMVLAGCGSTPSPYPVADDSGPPQAPRTMEEARARVAELKARSDAGDPNVKVYSSTTASNDPVVARARADQIRARLAAELSPAEIARRQAYVDSHPSLPPPFKEMIMSGMFAPAMKFDDVEQIVGALRPVPGDGRDPQAQVYMAQVGFSAMRLYFIDGKLARWSTVNRSGG